MLEKCNAERRAELLALLKACHDNEEAVDKLQRIVLDEGGLDAAAATMHGYIAKAVQMLSEYDDSPYRTSLVHLCSFIIERNQ